jgi:hypothetical protein
MQEKDLLQVSIIINLKNKKMNNLLELNQSELITIEGGNWAYDGGYAVGVMIRDHYDFVCGFLNI